MAQPFTPQAWPFTPDSVYAPRIVPGDGPVSPLPLNLAQIGAAAYHDALAQTPVTAFQAPCCPNPPACGQSILWRAQFKNCPTCWIGQAGGQAAEGGMQTEVAPLGDRYWVADLNPLIQARGVMNGALWNPYRHWNNLPLLSQFLWADNGFRATRDPNTQPVARLEDSFSFKQATQGPPLYTRF